MVRIAFSQTFVKYIFGHQVRYCLGIKCINGKYNFQYFNFKTLACARQNLFSAIVILSGKKPEKF